MGRWQTSLLGLIGFVLIATACSREPGKTSTLYLNPQKNFSQKVGALSIPSSYQMNHIIINIRGPGMELVYWTWDGWGPNDTMLTPPAQIAIDVPSGNARLIQFLGVYRDPTTDYELFSYGDTTVDLAPGDQAVNITANSFGDPLNNREAALAGQYVTSVISGKGYGPTDKIVIEFQPPTSAPRLVVSFDEIINGWFQVFSIKGIPFSYRLKSSGQELVGLSYDVFNSAITSGNPAEILKISTPDDYYYNSGCGTTCNNSDYHKKGEDLFLGYIGPAAISLTGAKACYPNTGSSLTNLYADSGFGTPLNWSPNYNTADISRVGGGAASNTCSSPINDFITEIPFNPNNFDQGKWSAVGFRGPFARGVFNVSPCSGFGGSQLAGGCYSSPGNVVIQWKYINNEIIGVNGVDGVALFTKIIDGCMSGPCNYSDDLYREPTSDLYKCGALPSLGFSLKGEYTDPSIQGVTLTNTYLGLGKELTGFLCPFKTINGVKTYFGSAAKLYGINGPYSTMSLYVNGVKGGTDVMLDNLLGTTATPTVDYYLSNAATRYDIYIKNGSNAVVCSSLNNLPDMMYPTATQVISGCTLADGGSYSVHVKGYDAGGNLTAQTNSPFNFTVDLTPPTISSVSISTCLTWNTGINIQVDGTINHSANDVAQYEWNMSYSGDSSGSNSNPPTYTSGPSTFLSMQTGMNAGGNYSASLTVNAFDSAGNMATQVVPITVTSGSCP